MAGLGLTCTTIPSRCQHLSKHHKISSTNLHWGVSGVPMKSVSMKTHIPSRYELPHVMFSRQAEAEAIQVLLLDAWDDEYNGVVVDHNSLPSDSDAFAIALKASLSNWKLKRKKGIWLKILEDQANLVPLAIQEGFMYHHAEPGYVMLTNWISNEPCMLPASPSHQIGIAGFVVNHKREVLVVKEKCSSSCLGVWKLPTGYINKSEDIFSGATREVKEETNIDTTFLEMVAFRHVHRVAFEISDLLFVCMLKPLSFDIVIDDNEIEDAKWMPLDEFTGQPFYEEDDMSMHVVRVCVAAYDEHNNYGFFPHQLASKFDGKMCHLYYNHVSKIV